MYRFSARSYENLLGVRPELVAVATLALERTTVDFAVIDGLRTLEEQREHVKNGVSWTMDSKHLDGRAIDVMAYFQGEGRWEAQLYGPIAEAFKSGAADLRVPIIWGGDWTHKDYGHFELAAAVSPPPPRPTVAA
jgi:peptidoglycan LD-endopeptidase CwlK